VCSCRGPSACKQGRRIYNTLLLQAMALYIHGPLRCKNLLGRIPNPHSRPALMHAANAPRRGIMHRISSPTPHRSTGNRTPSTTRTPTIRPPGGIPDTCSTHPHSPDQTPSRPRWKLCSILTAPHDQAHRQQPRPEHTPEPFYQSSNMEALRRSIDEMQQGKTVTKTLEELTALEDD